MNSYLDNDIIFSLATVRGKSALAIVRVSGQGCIEKLSKTLESPKTLLKAKTNQLVHVIMKDIDEVVLAVYREGHGYTGEESVEINCHGSISGISMIEKKMIELGFRQAKKGEFTLRAFLNNRIDLTMAEAVKEISDSRSEKAQGIALTKLNGALSDRITEIKDILISVMGLVEVQLDYSEDEIGEDTAFPREKVLKCVERLENLASTWSTGRLYKEGAKLVLSGASNAGKSSLFNLLLKQERSIVSPIEGTTRDFIEAEATLNGIPVRLFDTAGLRLSTNEIEIEGIKRTRQLIGEADLIVYLVDSVRPEEEYKQLKKKLESLYSDRKFLFVWNKVDLDSSFHIPEGFESLSVNEGLGFEGLINKIINILKGENFINEEDLDGKVIIESARQHELLKEAVLSLKEALSLEQKGYPLDVITIELQNAMNSLGLISGEVTSDDILDKIFSGFCVGK